MAIWSQDKKGIAGNDYFDYFLLRLCSLAELNAAKKFDIGGFILLESVSGIDSPPPPLSSSSSKSQLGIHQNQYEKEEEEENLLLKIDDGEEKKKWMGFLKPARECLRRKMAVNRQLKSRSDWYWRRSSEIIQRLSRSEFAQNLIPPPETNE